VRFALIENEQRTQQAIRNLKRALPKLAEGRRQRAAFRAARPCAVPLTCLLVFKILLSPIFFLVFRVKVEGRQYVPKKGGVLAANHQSFCDSFFLRSSFRAS